MVVVSGGAFGSPAILERSGIGAKSVLEKLNIPIQVDLEGVGHDYQGKVPFGNNSGQVSVVTHNCIRS